MLEQFATRGINLSLLASRPIGDALGRYRFVIDADGHIEDERMADALLGLRRFSPKVVFLGSYPRADRAIVHYPERYSDDVFVEARDWLRGLLSGEPVTDQPRPWHGPGARGLISLACPAARQGGRASSSSVCTRPGAASIGSPSYAPAIGEIMTSSTPCRAANAASSAPRRRPCRRTSVARAPRHDRLAGASNSAASAARACSTVSSGGQRLVLPQPRHHAQLRERAGLGLVGGRRGDRVDREEGARLGMRLASARYSLRYRSSARSSPSPEKWFANT